MPPDAAPENPVIIVGGGWAGLSAAYQLCRNKLPVVLIESARQLGGRARSVRFDDTVVDNGQHLLIGAYQSLLTLLTELGVDTETAFVRSPLTLHGVSKRKADLHLKAPGLPAPLHLLAAFVTARGLSPRDKFKAIRFGRRLSFLDIAAGRDISVQALLHSEGQTPALISKLWSPLCVATLNTDIGDASARLFLRVLKETFLQLRRHSDLLIPKIELGNVLPQPCADYLETNGARIILGQRVSGLEIQHNAIEAVYCGDMRLPASHVILATPHIISRRLMSAHAMLQPLCRQLGQLGNDPIATLYLRYPVHVRLPHTMIGMQDTTAQWVFDRGCCGQPGLMAVVISARGPHSQLSRQELTDRIAAELAETFPRWPPHEHSLLIREKRATFNCGVGIDMIRPANNTAVSNLLLAGDYTDTGLPATLEGAVRSGNACAGAVLDMRASR